MDDRKIIDVACDIIKQECITSFSRVDDFKMQLKTKPNFTATEFIEIAKEIGLMPFENLSVPHCFKDGIDTFTYSVVCNDTTFRIEFHLQERTIDIELHEY